MRWCSCIGRWAGDGNNKDLVIAKIGNWVIEELSTHKFSITRLPILAITKSSFPFTADLSQRWQLCRRSDHKDESHGDAVDRAQSREGAGYEDAVSAQAKQSGGEGRHERVHDQQAGDEHGQSEEPEAQSAEVGGQQEYHELAGGFGAQSVNGPDSKGGLRAVVTGRMRGKFGLRSQKPADLPSAPVEGAPDHGKARQRYAALGSAKKRVENIDS